MSTLIAANVSVSSTLSVGNLVSNQSVLTLGNNSINSSSINSGTVNTNILAVDQIQPKSVGNTIITVPAGNKLYAPGSVLNVYNTVYTAPSSVYNGFVDFISLSVTPTKTNSKFLVMYSIPMSGPAGAYSCAVRLRRDTGGTNTYFISDVSGSRTRSTSWMWTDYYAYAVWELNKSYLDSPNTTNVVNYVINLGTTYAQTFYINRGYTDADSTSYGTSISSLTVLEIAG